MMCSKGKMQVQQLFNRCTAEKLFHFSEIMSQSVEDTRGQTMRGRGHALRWKSRKIGEIKENKANKSKGYGSYKAVSFRLIGLKTAA